MLSSIGSRAAADPEELHFRREARSRFVRTFLRYPAALPALILFVIVVLCALGAPLLTQYTPFEGMRRSGCRASARPAICWEQTSRGATS